MRKALFLLLALIILLPGCALSRPMHLVTRHSKEIIHLINLPNLALTAINSSPKLPFSVKTYAKIILGIIK